MYYLEDQRAAFVKISSDILVEYDSETQVINRVTCPCCGYPTLETRSWYDICTICGWEDDGQDDESSSEISGGPNGSYSLDMARENFREYGIMYSPDNNTTLTEGDSDERKILKTELIYVFQSMLVAQSDSLPKLWQQVLEVENMLLEELSASMKMHEQSIKLKD